MYYRIMTQTKAQDRFPWEVHFSRELKRRRIEANLTLYGLARALGERKFAIHQQQLDRIERGERAVRLNEAIVIASYFGLTLDAMAGASQEQPLPGELDLLMENVKEVVLAIRGHQAEAVRAWMSMMGKRERIELSVAAVSDYAEREPGDFDEALTAADAAKAMTSAMDEAFERAVRASADAARLAGEHSPVLAQWFSE